MNGGNGETKYVTWRDVPNLLADHSSRLRRLEYGMVAMLVMNGVNLAGGPNVPAAVFHAAVAVVT